MIDTVEKIYFNNQFICYQITYEDGKISSVPTDPDNTDYQEIQQWISKGNTVIDNGE